MLIVSDKIVFLFTSVMTQVLRVLTAFVMARLLTPNDYGLITLVAVIPGFVAVLGDCGIARALVQYRDLPSEIVEASGLTISVALCLFYSLLFLGAGYYLGLLKHDHRLVWVGAISGVSVILSGIYTFQMACLNRDLKFKAESFQNIIFSAALTTTGISMAAIAHHHRQLGVFALALQPLVAQILGNAVIFHRHPFRWPRAFSVAMAKKMLNYGWKVTLAQYVNNLQQQVVNLFVVIVGGVYGTGIFGRATQISDMIGFNLLSAFDRLLHPLLRFVRDDKERLRDIFVRGCNGATLLCCFGWAWLFGTAPDLIQVVIGPQWREVPPLLRIVSTALLANGLGMMGIVVTHALGKPLIWLRIVSTYIVMLVAALTGVLEFHRNLAAIAMAFAICQGTYSIMLWIWAAGTLRIPRLIFLMHMLRRIAVAVGSCASIFLVAHWCSSVRPIYRLAGESMVALIVFIGLGLLLDRKALLDVRTLVRRRRDAEPSPRKAGESIAWPSEELKSSPFETQPSE